MENILEGLNPQQKEAVEHFKGPLLILAGAGSGKTRVLTHRIAYLIDHYDVNPYHILALTFTNKAAGEMRERVDQIVGFGAENIWVSTFHSTCVRILRRYIEVLGYKRSFTIYDADDQRALMREIIKYLDLDPKKYKERAFLNVISNAKDELIGPEDYAARAQGDGMREIYARAYQEYEKRLHDANALDFDDLICKTIQMFQENRDILSYYRNRFRYILVDEYQDTNTAQFKLISLLASTPSDDGGVEHNLCVVGDDDQSIYKFRGANIMNILNFEQEYPDTRVIRLEENYRSTQNILDAANAVIHNNTKRKEKALWTRKDKGDSIYYSQFENEYEEAESVSSAIAHAVSNGKADYKDFAILYRTNAQSRVFEEKLINYNIPYRIVGAVNFYQRKEIKDILAYLRTIENGMDDISAKRIINVPKRGIGLTTIDRVSNYAIIHGTSFYSALQDYEYIENIGRSAAKLGSFVGLIESFRTNLEDPDYSIEQLIRDVVEQSGYEAMLAEDDSEESQARLENIEELINKAASYEEDHEEEGATLGGFLEEVALVADIDNVDDSTDIVLLMTLHSAKGLEFPYVYLVGMEDGIFPGAMAVYGEDPDQAAEEMEEERRLCYVGITRAMKKLSLSCARSRFRNGEHQFNRPSRFISEIPRYLLHAGSNSSTASSGGVSAAEFLKHQPGGSFSFGAGTGSSSTRRSGSTRSNTGGYGTGTWNPAMEQRTKQAGHARGKSGLDLLAGNPMISKGFGGSYKTPSAKSSSAAGNSQTLSYSEGDRVRHMRFGEGSVQKITPSGADFEVTVAFDNGNTRKMLSSFAKLKKV
ncbi:ATP-dependent helicase [Roseburia sp. AM59-24XD]|jgi:DNA helicase-2/ATP-dependent DNA helicase PcrA|uniref:ATP-dependent helicase n=1 Tax=Roseburia sp. AM59-24XD TaxID=2293138 RepID=UPI000E4F522F|nr:UvrD-helicase domain-containing protein [Roseburia sp. AM59-24XD]RHP83914.1 ATP-dependent DNA helicase PcrA [Roseburia sp. AM59-24XD]